MAAPNLTLIDDTQTSDEYRDCGDAFRFVERPLSLRDWALVVIVWSAMLTVGLACAAWLYAMVASVAP
jgi:hypothetical protein